MASAARCPLLVTPCARRGVLVPRATSPRTAPARAGAGLRGTNSFEHRTRSSVCHVDRRPERGDPCAGFAGNQLLAAEPLVLRRLSGKHVRRIRGVGDDGPSLAEERDCRQ
jgi:hypothetical protein